jgi:hypothetical protein
MTLGSLLQVAINSTHLNGNNTLPSPVLIPTLEAHPHDEFFKQWAERRRLKGKLNNSVAVNIMTLFIPYFTPTHDVMDK